MFESIRKTLGLWYARWQFRKDVDHSRQLTDFLEQAGNVLVVLPVGYDHAVVAGNTLKKLFDRLKNVHLTVVTAGVRGTALDDMVKSEVVRIDDIDIGKIYLPKKATLRRVLTRTYDVALDLNLDFVLHAAYICKASRAPVRVGIARQNSELFFNVQLNLDRTVSPQTLYEKYSQYLGMFS